MVEVETSGVISDWLQIYNRSLIISTLTQFLLEMKTKQ